MTVQPPVGPPPSPGQRHPGVAVAWVEDGTRLAVTTWGSSSSPSVPSDAQVADGELVLTVGRRGTAPPPPGVTQAMSADLAACTTVIEPPAGLDPLVPTRVRVGDVVLELPAAGPPFAGHPSRDTARSGRPEQPGRRAEDR